MAQSVKMPARGPWPTIARWIGRVLRDPLIWINVGRRSAIINLGGKAAVGMARVTFFQ
jgi:hypothetical protein